MASVTGTHRIAFALREHGQDVERELGSELDVIAQMATDFMRRLVPKHENYLLNSIKWSSPDAMTREVRPGVDYAPYVEDGIKPGGKGLPRFADPKSKNIVDWLESKNPSGFMGPHRKERKRVRKNSMSAVYANLELRDRYEGLAWHVRHFGVKAQPFVEPTAKAMEPVVLRRLDLAVRRALAARGGDTGGDSAGAVA